MSFPRVVIVQTSEQGFQACLREVVVAGFALADYFITKDPRAAEAKISTDENQLLVTGTFGANRRDAEDFVRRMKERNPRLEAAGFSILGSLGDAEPFDFPISKHPPADSRYTGDCYHLIREMHKFLSSLRSLES